MGVGIGWNEPEYESPEDWARTARQWAGLGVSQIVFRPRGQMAEINAAIAAALFPRFNLC